MKWSIPQLKKIQKYPFSFSETIDYKDAIKHVSDILDIDLVKVDGKIDKIDDETYRLQYHMDVPLTLQCALTLDPVRYHMEKDYDEIYSIYDRDDYFLIEKNTIDLSEIVWSNILIEKPINVTLPNAYEILKQRGIILDDTIQLDEDEEILFYSNGKKEE